jgi:methylmalonyl-CoA/ethylmalonyl-CoA epimerase
MLLNISQIGPIAQPVSDIERADDFYGNVLGLRKLYRYGNLTFFNCAGVRLLLEQTADANDARRRGCIYFRCADIALAVAELKKRGLSFDSPPHLIAKMDDHDLWMAFFTDPDGQTLALMQGAPKGYSPPPTD